MEINKELIFWPEMKIIMGSLVFFLFIAVSGLPGILDWLIMEVEASKLKLKNRACRRALEVVLRVSRSGVYLAVQLMSGILVVPIMRACASAFDCDWEVGHHWLSLLRDTIP